MQIANKRLLVCGLILLAAPLWGQDAGQIQQILQRLERIENENRALAEEVRSLRRELASTRSDPAPAQSPAAPESDTQERLAVQEQRVTDQAQSKVEASQHFPIRITGMALFNSYYNSRNNGGFEYPTVAAPSERDGGATMRQTTIGLDYRGPRTLWDGKVHGSVYMDFYGGTGTMLDQIVRFRTGSIGIDWKTRSVTAGIDKPIFNPREPASLAWVGISPLAGSGNLWQWAPQVSFEQLIPISGEATGIRARIGVVETRDAPYGSGIFETEPARPGLEGRFEFFHNFGAGRLEIAPGFHASATHLEEVSVPSRVFSLDWYFRPVARVEWSGAFFTGKNVHHFGGGALQQGYVVLSEGRMLPVHSIGGWGQLKLTATRRLSFNLFSGQQDDRNTDLQRGSVGKNLTVGANFRYRLGPNVLVGLEASQLRTAYIRAGTLLVNHYDLAVAYLF